MVKKEKIVLIGAGSLQFGLGSAGSILNSKGLEGSTISLHDINERSLKLIYQACNEAITEKKLNFELESTTDRKQALKNATFVINSIEVTPRFELWDQDYRIPRELGNKQTFGENGGPGGLFHAVRVIPPILDICDDIQKTCPNAFFINFSNPMSRICLAVKRKYPNLRTIGLCHEFQQHYPILTNILETNISNLQLKAGGLNHFSAILEIKYRDTRKDAYPDLRKKAPSALDKLKTVDGKNLLKYILEKYGYFPITGDSHYGEYIHWAWEVADMEGIKRFKDQYIQFINYESETIIKAIERGRGARLVKPDDERAIPIIEGILTNAEFEEPAVNIPNDDIITNLPRDLVIECPAIINKNGARGLKLGDYPKGLDALLKYQASVQDLVVDAILKKSREILLQALLADPIVDSTSQAEAILNKMLDVQKDKIQIKF